jgi:hypothetical protein
MAKKAIFEGLVRDEYDRPIEVAVVGGEAFYVYDDDGFMRHIESELVDRQVLEHFIELTKGHEDMIAEGTMRMLGQEDIFTKAAIEKSLNQAEQNIDQVLQSGLPQEALMNLGMMGFMIIIDRQGQLLEVDQPSGPEEEY